MADKTDIFFISGHVDLEDEEFLRYYQPQIDQALEMEASFVLGDARGADGMAQKYLATRTKKVTIYHLYERPLYNHGNFSTIGDFKSHAEKDAAMTNASSEDIAWVRSPSST